MILTPDIILTHIFLIYGANSDKLSNSDKSFLELCLHSTTSYSTVLSLMISDYLKESTIRYFIWYHAQNQDRVLDSGGALCKKDKYLPSFKTLILPSEILIF